MGWGGFQGLSLLQGFKGEVKTKSDFVKSFNKITHQVGTIVPGLPQQSEIVG